MLALLLRTLQKHNYKLGNIKRDILKLIVNTLLDDGYIIKNVNTDLDIITAEKGSPIKDEETRNSSIWTKDSGHKGSLPPKSNNDH